MAAAIQRPVAGSMSADESPAISADALLWAPYTAATTEDRENAER
jgi:hypothetical protein